MYYYFDVKLCLYMYTIVDGRNPAPPEMYKNL